MIPYSMIPLAILGPFTLSAFVVSFWALYRSKSWKDGAAGRVDADRQLQGMALDALQKRIDGLSAQLQEIRHQAPTPVTPQLKSGLNLNKRSQALRMHRGGDSPDQIAASLELPRQEVDLLIKVHRIVMSRI